MALTDLSKSTLSNLLYCLRTDPALAGAVRSVADRLLSSDQGAALIALCGVNSSGQHMPTMALDALAADITAA